MNGLGGGGGNGGGGQRGRQGGAPEATSTRLPTRLATPDRTFDFTPRRPRDPSPAPAAHAAGAPVTIETLRLRVPGHNAAAGRSLVEEAVRQVAERLPAGLTGRIPALKLRVRPRRAGAAHLRDAIADSLLEMLTLRGRGER
jgi:hypothetical protein